jgi:hypothetical protein
MSIHIKLLIWKNANGDNKASLFYKVDPFELQILPWYIYVK